MIFDTHCHLNDEQILTDVDQIIERAKLVGVDKFLVVGWDKESSLRAIELSERFDCIYAAIGFHPCNIFDVTEKDLNELMAHHNHPKVVAIGEIGLDYHWNKLDSEKELQKEWFIKQIKIANDLKKPISVHSREALDDCLKILKENKPLYGGVIHCYSGSVEQLKDVFDLGMYIGLDGPVTFLNAKTPKEVCEEVPLDKLVVETDSPYLPPHPLRGTLNEPANIALIIDEIARIKGISKKHIMDVIYNNSTKLFNL